MYTTFCTGTKINRQMNDFDRIAQNDWKSVAAARTEIPMGGGGTGLDWRNWMSGSGSLIGGTSMGQSPLLASTDGRGPPALGVPGAGGPALAVWVGGGFRAGPFTTWGFH